MMMWEDTQGDMTAKCSYIKETNEYLVEVLLRAGKPISKRYKANYDPIFGMDILDQQISLQIAEELAQKLEAQDKKSI